MRFHALLVAAVCAGSVPLDGCATKKSGEHEDANWSVTAWGERYEVFAECEPLAVGTVARSHTHVTVLSDFSALSKGTVSALLRAAGDGEQVFLQPTAARDGIFSIELKPQHAGEFALSFRIESSAGTETIDAGRVAVGSAESPGGVVQAPVYSAVAAENPSGSAQAVSFLKEQQWRTPFHTEWAKVGTIQAAVQGPARVRPAAGAEAVLTAPLDGVVGVESRVYVGLMVSRGTVLMRLAPRAAANQTLAELSAEAGVATQRLSRLEQLLEVEAVSRAEVETARARVATLAAQLLAAQGGGGTQAPVRAPFTGEIAQVHVIPGQAVSAGEALVRIVRRTPQWLEVSLLPNEATRLTQAPAGFVVNPSGAPPIEVPPEHVRVVSVAPEVDATTGKVTAIFEVTEQIPVQLGTIVDAEILLAEERSGVVIPASSLVDDAGVAVVYVQLEGESFARRPIDVLGRQADRLLVAGLVAGERVVTVGGSTIRRQTLMSTGPVEGHVH